MKKEFTIPERLELIAKEVVCAIIESIPAEWHIVRGRIYAPKNILRTGEALASTKFIFASQISQMIVKTEPDQIVDIFGILMEGKKPAAVEFGQYFGHCEIMPFDQARRMILAFIKLGYRGRITFQRSATEYIGDDSDFECEVWLPSQDEKALPYFEVEQNRDDLDPVRNPGATVEPILKCCQELGLAEKPVLEPAQR